MDTFEYTDLAGDTLRVEQSQAAGPGRPSMGVFFETEGDDNIFIFVEDRKAIETIRDRLTTWLDENKPKPPTNVGAVIEATVTPGSLLGVRTLARMPGEGHVWRDLDNGSLYQDHAVQPGFEVKFEGVAA